MIHTIKIHDEKKIHKYFNEYIDIDNTGFINVEKWIIAMKQTGIIKEEIAAEKVFYLICFLNKCEEYTVTREMFAKLLRDVGCFDSS